MKTPARLRSLLICSALLVSLVGCANREHMRDDYGKEVREFYAKQRVYAQAVPEPPTGLDSEEAAGIHASYRKSIAGSTAAPADANARVLMLREPKPGVPQ